MSAHLPMHGATGYNTHDAAVINTLKQADDAARRGDYDGALSWLQLVEAIGDALPRDYEAKRKVWLASLGAARAR